MWEGQVTWGYPRGFSRYIFAGGYSFVGYLKTWDTTLSGTGLLFNKFKLKYSGYYEDGTIYQTTEPEEEQFGIFHQ